MQQTAIPLYAPGEHIIGFFSVNELEAMKGVELTRNRRGYVKRAQVKPLTCHVAQFNWASPVRYGEIRKGGKDPRPNEHLGDGLRCWSFAGVRF